MITTDPSSPRYPKLLSHTRYFKTPDAPQPAKIDLSKSLNQLLSGYQDTSGGFYNLEKQYQPLYNQLGLQTQGQSMFGFTDPTTGQYTPGTVALGNAANSGIRTSNVNDLSGLGPAVSGALDSANPYLGLGLNALTAATGQAGAGSPILSTLNQQAGDALKSGGALTPQEQRDITQGTLAGYAQRGSTAGNSSLITDLLSRDAATRARTQQAQQFGETVQGLNTQQNQLFGSLAGNLTNTASSALTNPLLQIIGLGNLNPGSLTGGSGGSVLGSTLSANNSLFPLAPGFDVAGYNANAQNASNIAGANNAAATNSGYLSLIGALLSDDRLKTSIRRTGRFLAGGIERVSWIFKLDPQRRRWSGVLASEVEKARPEAVVRFPLMGLRLVNYNALGITMEEG
jgi:hypothetical protein